MTVFIDIDEEAVINPNFKLDNDRDYKEAIINAVEQACKELKCPYEVEVNVMITDNDNIHQINLENRDIDRPTDVLSFPYIEFSQPGDFTEILEDDITLFNQDTGELMLGDIVLSTDKIVEQSREYGHSILRELSLIVIHSMLHLCGYDHMEGDGDTMEKLQSKILEDMNITRD